MLKLNLQDRESLVRVIATTQSGVYPALANDIIVTAILEQGISLDVTKCQLLGKVLVLNYDAEGVLVGSSLF